MSADKRVRALKVLQREEQFSEEYLQSKSALMRDKVISLGQSGKVAAYSIQRIEAHLDASDQTKDLRKKADLYELAYEAYIPVAPDEDLVNVFLSLRARAYRLDRPNKEIWSQQKLDLIEGDLRLGKTTTGLRSEIESLARAIYECGFRYTRDKELKSELVRFALIVDIVVYLIVLTLFVVFGIKQVKPDSPLQVILIATFGVSGGLLSATLQLRQRRFYRHYLRTELVGLFFRAVFGAVAAVIVILFLELRFIDFPFLHTNVSDGGSIPPTALYVIGFASGFTERIFFGAIGKVSTKGAEVDKKDNTDS